MKAQGGRTLSAWVHAGLATLAASLCGAVWLWSGQRAASEQRSAVRQSTIMAEVLTAAYAGQIKERLGVADVVGVRSTDDCVLCVISRRDATGMADLAPLLRGMAQAGPGPAVVALIIAKDGAVRAVHADGHVSRSALHVTDAGRVMRQPAVLGQDELGGPPMAVASAPLGPELAIAVGIDLTNTLATQSKHRRQDHAWAIGAIILLLLAAGTACVLVECVVRRDRRLSNDRGALSLVNLELKRARDRARATSLELQAIFASMSDGVSHFDRELRLVQWNQRFPELSGVPRELLRAGMPLAEVLRAQARGGEFGEFGSEEALEAEVGRRIDILGTTTPMHVVERLRPGGTAIELRRATLPGGGLVTIYTDITVRKQVEAVREAARAQAERTADEKARFVAIVSHEIRTPLNVTLNALGLIDRGALPPAQRSLVDTGLQAGDALLALLNDILDLARLESGHLSITPEPFALRPMIEGVADMYRQMARERDIELRVTFDPRVPDRVSADAGRLRQLAMNLVSNAAKFAAPGVVRIAVEVAEPGVPSLRLSVTDSGPVIAPSDRARLFRPFSQLNRVAGASAGSGLGLAICSMLATRMGGAIGCETASSDGRPDGNQFWVELPLNAAAPPAEAAPVAAWNLPGARVLVVEDLAANRMVLSTMLQCDGHIVEVAGSGAEALQAVARRSYDIVLMDVMMPGMDGLETTRRIRALNGCTADTPIVGVTADASLEARAACLAAGMACVLTKPIKRSALADAVQQQVWGRRTATARQGSRAGAKVLDIARLEGLPDGEALLLACLDELREQCALLDDAAVRGDVATLVATAHAMAGAAGNHGLERLNDRLQALMCVSAVDLTVARSVAMVAADLDDVEEAASPRGLAHAG